MDLKIGDFIHVYDIFVDAGKVTLAKGEIIGLVGDICHVKDTIKQRAMVFDLELEMWQKISPLEIELT